MKLKVIVFILAITGKLYCQQVVVKNDMFYFPKVNLKEKNTDDIRLLISDAWEFFERKDTLEVKIIQHTAAQGTCGAAAYASATIVEDKNGNIFRILCLCNRSKKYKKNQTIKVIFIEKPSHPIEYPILFTEDIITHKINNLSIFDILVYKTTWGVFL